MRQARTRTAARAWVEWVVMLAGLVLLQGIISEHWTSVTEYGSDIIRWMTGAAEPVAVPPVVPSPRPEKADGWRDGPEPEPGGTETGRDAGDAAGHGADDAVEPAAGKIRESGGPRERMTGGAQARMPGVQRDKTQTSDSVGTPDGSEIEAAGPTGTAAEPEPIATAGKVALTFDDGPDGKYTPKVLDILSQYGVAATFFVVGVQAERYPDMLARIRDEGHEIGSHGYAHADMGRMTAAEAAEDLRRADEALREAADIVPALFRPPYGSVSDELKAALAESGKTLVRWNVDPRDWDGASAEAIASHVLERAKDGAVILLHSFGGKNADLNGTIEALPVIIEGLLEQGFELTTVSGLERGSG